jgi:methionyl-tRNA formyltransferase
MNNRRVVFVGAVRASVAALRALLATSEISLVGVITKRTSSFNADHTDLAPIAEVNHIPFKYVRDINSPHVQEWITQIRPDVIFVLGWSQLLNRDTLSLAPKGVVGFHPALLPQNRGRHPLIWALVLGLKKTGSTFFVMDERADSGAILSQQELQIDDRETATSLYRKIEVAIAKQIPEFLPRYLSGILVPAVQPQVCANSWRKRSRDDGLIDFRMSTSSIDRLVRALTKPYPGAEIRMGNERFPVWQAEPVLGPVPDNFEPGKVLETNTETRSFVVKTDDGAIRVLNHDVTDLPEVGSYL